MAQNVRGLSDRKSPIWGVVYGGVSQQVPPAQVRECVCVCVCVNKAALGPSNLTAIRSPWHLPEPAPNRSMCEGDSAVIP